jgi:hypothetical protein
VCIERLERGLRDIARRSLIKGMLILGRGRRRVGLQSISLLRMRLRIGIGGVARSWMRFASLEMRRSDVTAPVDVHIKHQSLTRIRDDWNNVYVFRSFDEPAKKKELVST